MPSVINSLKIVVCFLLDDSPAPELYVPTFRNTLFYLRRLTLPLKMEQSILIYRRIKFRCRGITQKK
jgi:hypothetical protein